MNHRMRAADLVPGRVYLSPSGRLCRFDPPCENGLSRTCYLFTYLSKRGDRLVDDGFALSASNATAIAKMTEAPLTVPVFTARKFSTDEARNSSNCCGLLSPTTKERSDE